MIFILIILAFFLFLVWASADIGSSIYIKSYCKAKVKTSTVALTFDDGPDPYMTLRVLDVLKKYNVQATFF